MDFDTGSSDLFLPSTSCDSSCSGHKLYNPSASSTSQDLGNDFTLSYGDGSMVTGEQYSDVVTVAGMAVRLAMFFFSFRTSAHMSHRRLRTRYLALQMNMTVLAVPRSPPTAYWAWLSSRYRIMAQVSRFKLFKPRVHCLLLYSVSILVPPAPSSPSVA